ncbi:hydrogenase large subunit [Desulfocicer vacuolatum DSM 3385]|uniref:Hydrogenase large subunit n=1 Tax=Desulfocicer vacuolatum DSM 3385 TaxID=1121400 RepID=A0A1W2A698_9BACT|nr:nickel-dependent hydrogenase large subunit [Desulfocicer vacuolatum]SMC56269.1 hydrogenase large subunit [Desulfocicer vacuolatum DSM 3385]
MSQIIKGLNIPVNRVEGDLEVRVDVVDHRIDNAWSAGTMFRGFESMMVGRGPLDGLVITPRICGICSLTHLSAAVTALDSITGITPPDNAIRLRNIALIAETIQSDMRQAILMYMADFTNAQAYRHHPLFKEAVDRYQMLKGTSVLEVIRKTKRLIEVIAIIGGQWPHTSFMVPGGVTSIPDTAKLMQCRLIIEQFKEWFESRVLGCTMERWQAVSSFKDLENWLGESPCHRNSEVGFFLRFAWKAGLDTFGRGTDNYISFGNFPFPRHTGVVPLNQINDKDEPGKRQNLVLTAPGFATGITPRPLDPTKITEDVSAAWFEQEKTTLHPFDGITRPYASGSSGEKYSWVKAPRYNSVPAETGPLAEMIMDKVPLFHDMIQQKGASALIRQLARMVRPASLLPAMGTWLNELMTHRDAPFYTSVKSIPDGEGAGMVQAPRGALGHWVKIKNRKISHYQIITPTAWNGSPRDKNKHPGPWEKALKGVALKNLENPVEAGHVIRSFDPCMVCAVHTLKKDGTPHKKFHTGWTF